MIFISIHIQTENLNKQGLTKKIGGTFYLFCFVYLHIFDVHNTSRNLQNWYLLLDNTLQNEILILVVLFTTYNTIKSMR